MLLTPDQWKQLATPTYKLRKEKKSSVKQDVLIDLSQVSVVGPMDLNQSTASASSSTNVSLDDSSFKKELSDLKDGWSTRFARIEALLTMGSNPISAQPISAVGHIAPVFYLVKVPQPPPTGVLSSSPFLNHTVSSHTHPHPPPRPHPPHPLADSAPGPGQEQVLDLEASLDKQQLESSSYQPVSVTSQPTTQAFASPLENLYPDRSQDTEPAFGPPDQEPVCYDDLPEDQASGSEIDPQERQNYLRGSELQGDCQRGTGLHGMVFYPGPGVYLPVKT